ncbi:MAG: hypothetical protein ACXW25_04660, partial [Rhodospirillales bacterium]
MNLEASPTMSAIKAGIEVSDEIDRLKALFRSYAELGRTRAESRYQFDKEIAEAANIDGLSPWAEYIGEREKFVYVYRGELMRLSEQMDESLLE